MYQQTGQEVSGELHNAYNEHLFKLRKVGQRMFTLSARALTAERLAYLVHFFEPLIAGWQGEM